MQIGTATVGFPPVVNSFACLSSNVECFEVTGTGKLISFSKLTYGPVGFEEDLPYSAAHVDWGTKGTSEASLRAPPNAPLSIDMTMITALDGELTAGAPIQPRRG